MKRSFVAITVLSLVGFAPLSAQERAFCTGDNCIDETLEVRFGVPADVATAPSELEDVSVDDTVNVLVAVDNETDDIKGWSMGVAHDTAILRIDEVTTEGLTLPTEFFSTTTIAFGGDPAPGFVSAYVVQIFPAPGDKLAIASDIALVRASYTVVGEVPSRAEGGTKLEFVENLIPSDGSPPTAVNFTVGSSTRKPATLIDGQLFGGDGGGGDTCEVAGADWAFYFGPAATTDAYSIESESFPISLRNIADALGFSMGVQISGTDFTFENEVVGTDGDRLIELIITDLDGTSQTPSTNAATSTLADNNVESVTLGADLQIGEPDDSFLAVDLDPGVGGPGFTAGFVVDVSGTGAVIPALGDTPDCPVHEALIVTLGEDVAETEFSRGDANGDDKINVTDAVVIAQNIFLDRLVFFDCDDMLDANNDEVLNAADPIAVLEWIFLNGPALAAPFRTCGVDTGADGALDCAASNCSGG